MINMTLGYLTEIIGGNLNTYVFGHPILMGIFLLIILIFMSWKFGLGADGAIVIMSLGFISLAGGTLIPGGKTWDLLIFLVILCGIMFVLYYRYFRA